MTRSSAVPTLLHVFSTFDVGGPQVRFGAIVNRFGREFRHGIVSMDGAYAARVRLNLDTEIFYPNIAVTKGRTLANILRFRAALKRLAPDVLVTYNWGAIEWAMANWPGYVRHVHVEDGFGPEEARGQLPRRAMTRRYVLGRSTLVLPSRTLQTIATETWKINPRNIQMMPNGIDCARFAVKRKAPTAWPLGGPTIGTVAVLRREKNLVRLLDAFRIVRDAMECRLVVAGEGPERSALEAHATSLGLGADVVFTGYTEATERVYADLDLFALSSDTEQMPTSVLEAMAAALPVVATDVGDVRHMVAPENRKFLMPLDASALGSAMLTLLRDPELCRQLGEANQQVARRDFDQERMFSAYQKLFRGQ